MDNRISVLLDTDIGANIDDAACLAYLLGEPRCELVGVTTVSGHAQKRARLADAICRAAGRDAISIASGTERPILVPQRRTSVPQTEVLSDWPHSTDFEPFAAVRFMRKMIRNRPGEITLVAVGPLTNVGLLFALDEKIPSLLKSLWVMGGAYFDGDRLETNFRSDPHAAAVVLANPPADTRIHGLDVTLQCTQSADDCLSLFRGGTLDVIGQMAEVFFRERSSLTFHDPLAAACACNPGLCTYRTGTVRVDLTGQPEPGRTSFKKDPQGPHRVAAEVDVNRFFTRYFSAIATLRA